MRALEQPRERARVVSSTQLVPATRTTHREVSQLTHRTRRRASSWLCRPLMWRRNCLQAVGAGGLKRREPPQPLQDY